MLKLTVKTGEYLLIGDDIKLVFAGGTARNLRILVDAPKTYNVVRSNMLEGGGAAQSQNHGTTHYREREISPEAQEKIRRILMEDRKRAAQKDQEEGAETKVRI